MRHRDFSAAFQVFFDLIFLLSVSPTFHLFHLSQHSSLRVCTECNYKLQIRWVYHLNLLVFVIFTPHNVICWLNRRFRRTVRLVARRKCHFAVRSNRFDHLQWNCQADDKEKTSKSRATSTQSSVTVDTADTRRWPRDQRRHQFTDSWWPILRYCCLTSQVDAERGQTESVMALEKSVWWCNVESVSLISDWQRTHCCYCCCRVSFILVWFHRIIFVRQHYHDSWC